MCKCKSVGAHLILVPWRLLSATGGNPNASHPAPAQGYHSPADLPALQHNTRSGAGCESWLIIMLRWKSYCCRARVQARAPANTHVQGTTVPAYPRASLETCTGKQQPLPACLPQSQCQNRHSEQQRGSFPLPLVPSRSHLGHQQWLVSLGGLLTMSGGSVRPAGPRCRLVLPSLLSALWVSSTSCPAQCCKREELPGSHLLTTAAPPSCPTL